MSTIRKISDIMQKELITFKKENLLEEIVCSMQKNKISSALICENDKVVGIITERDILKESLTPEDSITKLAQDVMTKPPLTIKKTMDYREAYIYMNENKIRHLIVVNDDDTLAGVVSESDFLEQLTPEQLLAIKDVQKIMIKNVITAASTDSIKQCLNTMNEKRISTLVIKEGKKAVGIISERDTLALIQLDSTVLDQDISTVMVSPLITIHNKETVIASQALMKKHNIRRLIVVDEDENMMGLITRHDLVKNVPNYYIQVLKDIVEHQQFILDEKVIFQNAINSLPYALVFATDTQGNIKFVNYKDERLKHSVLVSQNQHSSTLNHQLFETLQTDTYNEYLETQTSLEKVVQISLDETNQELYFQTTLSKVFAADNLFQGYLFIAKDITERFDAQKKLRQSAKVFQNTTEGVIITDAEGNIVDINDAFSVITGFSKEDSITMKPSILRSGRHNKTFYKQLWQALNTTGNWKGEIYNRRKNGEIYPQWLNISSVKTPQGNVENYIAVFSDITQLKESEEQLDFLIHHDHLTSLPNRTLLKARLEHTLSVSKRHSTITAVMFMNLDNFKKINDVYGHTFGDEVLMSVANRISALLREDDTLAHVGGDEFVIVMNNFKSIDTVNRMVQKIINTFQDSYTLRDQKFWVTTSMGISIFPEDGAIAEQLIKNADTAMYEAKSDGKNSFKYYNDKMSTDSFERVLFENALQLAVANEEFEVHYQPQENLQNDSLVGFEALVRWQHPTLGRISPDKFIPIAEETKLIIEIGKFVLEQACKDILLWKKEGICDGRVAVNVSGIQIEHSDFVQTLKNSLEKYLIDPSMLEIEITESIIMNDPQKWITVLHEIKELGVAISIDDFGTGYSSLSYLRSFPVDTLKIDLSFVQDLPEEKDACAIANAIISMSKSLGLTTLAEGVENEEQKAYLKSVGCNQMQGFLLSRPMSAEDTTQWLKSRMD